MQTGRNERRYDPNDERSGRTPGPFTGRGPLAYRRADARIHEDVCDLLEEHGEVDARNIEIRVEDGEVTLEGSVTDRYQKRVAEDVVYAIRGVNDVHNRLTIRREKSPEMQEATRRDESTEPSMRHMEP